MNRPTGVAWVRTLGHGYFIIIGDQFVARRKIGWRESTVVIFWNDNQGETLAREVGDIPASLSTSSGRSAGMTVYIPPLDSKGSTDRARDRACQGEERRRGS